MSTDNEIDTIVETDEEELRAVERAPSLRTYLTAELAEFQIRSGGDGRTVEAYAVPFGEAAEVLDAEGHYFEEFQKGAFGRQLARSGIAGITVLYNHGRDLLMRPSERFAIPIGKPLELREDGPGLFTTTRYASTPLGDEILQLVDEGVLTHQSVQFVRTPTGKGTRRIRGGHRATGLDLVIRHDVRLVEYGPTPIPVYRGPGAQVVGVRATQLAAQIHELSDEDRQELSDLIRADRTHSPVEGDDQDEHEPEEPAPDVGFALPALRHEQLKRIHNEGITDNA